MRGVRVTPAGRRPGPRAVRGLAVLALAGAALLPAATALAEDQAPGSDPVSGEIIEGPGYGGTADELMVSWTEVPIVHAAARGHVRPLLGDDQPPAPDLLETGDSTIGLFVQGVGFRGRSAVVVRVGEADAVDLRTDPTGTLAVQVAGVRMTGVQPGMSVVAVGRSPSGTTRTLVGAVPPRPAGLAPSDLVPWIAAGAGLLALGWQVHRRRHADALPERVPAGSGRAGAEGDSEGDGREPGGARPAPAQVGDGSNL